MSEKNWERLVMFVAGAVSMSIVISFVSLIFWPTQSMKPELQGAIGQAWQNGQYPKKVSEEAWELGIKCWASKTEECATLVKKSKENERLRNLLALAKSKDVSVFAEKRFYIGQGWIDVDANAPAEEIVEFLLGPQDRNTLQSEQEVSPSQP